MRGCQHGGWLGAAVRPARHRVRAPGPRADQRRHRHHRGGEEPHPDDRSGGRRRRQRRPVQLQDRRRGPRQRHRRRARAAALAGLRGRRHRAGVPDRRGRTADRDPGSAARRPGRAVPRAARGAAERGADGHGRRGARPGRLSQATRPVFVAGRGARNARARAKLEQLADHCGALLATSAAAKGLFRGNPWDLDVSGGFASPLAAELISGADVIVGGGCSLNMWTTRHGALVSPGTVVAQVDDEPDGIGGHRPVSLAVLGDVAAVARDVADAWGDEVVAGYRSDELRRRIEEEGRWRDVPFADESDGRRIDPRTLTIALDDMLPADRLVAVDSGNFMGYPSMYMSVPDADGFCFTQAYQSIGLGLASAIGAAIARPDRLTVAALGD